VGLAVLVTSILPASTLTSIVKPLSQLHFDGEPGYASWIDVHVPLDPGWRQLVQFGSNNFVLLAAAVHVVTMSKWTI
jgi:hypothetical protein